jgi:hypothetical protein
MKSRSNHSKIRSSQREGKSPIATHLSGKALEQNMLVTFLDFPSLENDNNPATEKDAGTP